MAATSASMVLGMWFWLALAGGVNVLMPGGAPLPPDPALSAVAPPDCLWYASYSGMGPADPDSENQAEQLYAEPQVQRFVAEMEKQIMRALKRQAGPGREQRVVFAEAPVLVKALTSRPFVVYVEEVRVRDGGDAGHALDVDAAFILNAGDQRDEIATALERLSALKPPRGPAIVEESVAGVQWKRIETPPHAPAVRWGWKDNYFILAVGNETPATVLERMGGSPPNWLTQMRTEHPIERELSIGYVNLAGIVERVRPFAEDSQQWMAAERLGLTGLKALHAVSGYDEVGCMSMAHLVTDGERRGLLSLLPHKPLSKRDLSVIPNDPLTAVACRLDAGEVWDEVVRIVSDFEPRAEEQFDEALWQIETQVGVNVRDDLVRSLDDVWVAYLPGGDLMSSWLGSSAAVRVKDRAALERAIGKLVAVAQREMQPGRRGGASIRRSVYDGNAIFSIEVTGEPFPFSPSWCVSDQWLVFGLMPQTVRDVLDRSENDSLADVDIVRDALAASNAPAVIGYQDTPRLVRSIYPWVQMGAQVLCSQLRREGIDVDAAALPSAETIVKHLRPGVTTIAHSRDGFHFTSRHSLPGGGNMVAAAPIGVALLLPAVQAARNAAQVAQETNNMRQIMLACLNYESANARLPNNIYDDDGNALLSWRVRILPYLEEGNLHNQIRMDEPWDSEHNRQFANRVPQVYQSVSEPAPAGKTRYVALAHDDSLMPGEDPLRIAQITDGTSNTLFVVQANQEAAVDWMKPDDIEFDADRPFAGLDHRSGMYLGAMCDGSVHRFSLLIADDVMRALVTRNGGEVVDRNVWSLPPGQRDRIDAVEPAAAPFDEEEIIVVPAE